MPDGTSQKPVLAAQLPRFRMTPLMSERLWTTACSISGYRPLSLGLGSPRGQTRMATLAVPNRPYVRPVRSR